MQAVFKLADRIGDAMDYDRLAKGLIEYRRGNLITAAKYLQDVHRGFDALASQATCFLAMIEYRQGNVTAAKANLEEASKSIAAYARSGELAWSGDWHEYGRAAITRAEAERLILGRQVTPFL
jgi:hypothetical protein